MKSSISKEAMRTDQLNRTWLQPWIFAAAAVQALSFNLLQSFLAAGTSGGAIVSVIALSAALPALLLLYGFRPRAPRWLVGGLVVAAALLLGMNDSLTNYISISFILVPVLTVVLLPWTRLRPWKSVILRLVVAAVVAAIFFATMIYVPYPFGWVVAIAPWLGLAGEKNRQKRQLILPIGLGVLYGLSLVALGPFTAAAAVSGCIGLVGLSALFLLGKSEGGTNPSPYAQ